MYYVEKRMEVAGSHYLTLPYPSKCTELHGHNWIITVACKSKCLNDHGMVVDFAEIKRIVGQLDHTNINDLDGLEQPTAENIARWIGERVPHCDWVEVQESEGNKATWVADD